MDLHTAIKHAIDGKAVLFLGSGASVGARPIVGDKFLTGRELAVLLSEPAGLKPPSEDLNFAAQRYRKVVSDAKFVELLQGYFSASTVTESHCRLSEINWHGIYTTNYDNVIERAFADRQKKLIPLTPDQDTRNHTNHKNSILHINGYIDKLTPSALGTSFKLTNTSYLTEAFANSNWSFVFRRNLETARAIIFLGYSMYDIDIQRIMFGGDALKNKTIFIEKLDKSREEIESSLQFDFGEVFPIGLDGFWKEYDIISKSYIPEDLSSTYFAFEELHPKANPEPLRDDDMFALLLTGNARTDLVWSTITGGLTAPYYIVREQISKSMTAINQGAHNVVVSSDLANGKTLFCLGLSCNLASQGYRVFWLNDDVDETAEEVERLCALPGKVALVIENYSRRLNEIRQVQTKRGDELLLIVSGKTSLHEVYNTDLSKILETSKTIELDINILSNPDLSGLEKLLDTYKLWGDRDALPPHKKRNFLVKECGQQLSGVLLDIIKSPEIQRRFHGLFDSFRQNSEVTDVVVAASVLKMIGFNNPREIIISEVLDSNYLYSLEFKRNSAARELLLFSSGAIVTKSSILAKFGLNSFSDARQLVDRLIKIAINSHDRGESSSLYFGIYRDLVTFSILQSMLPAKGKRDSLIRFYEGVKNLRAAKNHPHFWLQYAIARLASDRPDDLRMAKLFLDSAYAHAERRANYHTRHLDNVLARYWIQHSLTVPEISSALLEFADGHALLIKLARTGLTDSPYKVARMYLTFYNAKKAVLSESQKLMLKKMSEGILEQIPRLPENVQGHSTVEFCRSDLLSLVADVDAEPAHKLNTPS